MTPISAGRIISVAAILLILYCIAEKIFKFFNNTVRRGTLALFSNTVWPLLINIGVWSVAFWYWALPISLAVGVIFIPIIRHELKEAYTEELEGFIGLNEETKRVRAEAFADLSIEEQKEYKASVRPHKFYWWLFVPLVALIPFLIILLLEQLGVGDYLFQIVYFKK
jgi:ABC-type Na+ efflux pump permease subunit